MTAKLTSDELVSLSADVEARALAAASTVTPSDWADWGQWYYRANAVALTLADARGCDPSLAAAVIAVLSPRVRWANNVDDAERILSGDDATLVALGDNVLKAWRLMEGEEPGDVLGGRKVRSFWRNILAPSESMDVTLDSWILTLLVPEAKNYHFLERRGVYDAVSDGVRSAAAIIGVMPHELQAVLWVSERGAAD